MAMAAAMALICYVSSNPSPNHWVVSGRVEAVARLDELVAKTAVVRRIAHAVDGDTAFSRYEMGPNPPNLVMYRLFTNADQNRIVGSRLQQVVPSCPDGQRSNVGNGRSDIVVGLIGPAAAIGKLGVDLGPGAKGVHLEDGRSGIGFALRTADRAVYDVLLRGAATAKLGGVDLVLMQPGGEAGTSPGREPSRRTDSGHRGED